MIYLFGFEIKTLFFDDFTDKVVQILNLIINCLFICIVVSLYFFIRLTYKNRSLTLFDNLSNQNYACIFLTIQSSIKKISLGFLHIIIPDE